MLDPPPDLTQAAGWMPMVFLVVMGLAMLAYVVLDGYDLGVGVLMNRARGRQGQHDCQHQPLLGCQRDLAGAGRGHLADSVPDGARRHPGRPLPAPVA
jgi:hypothetical protein